MKKRKLHELVPPGVDGEKHADRLYTGLLLSTILSCMGFAFSIGIHWKRIQNFTPTTDANYVLSECDFLSTLLFPLLGVSIFFGFVYVAIAAIILAISYYRGFSQESQSLYLMRRLPDRWEYHRRCLALPLMTILAGLVSIPILIGLFYAIYLHATPEQCLQPDQWEVFRASVKYLLLPLVFRL